MLKFDSIMTTHVTYSNVQIYFLKFEYELSKQMINSLIHLSTAMHFQVLLFKKPKTPILMIGGPIQSCITKTPT